MVNSNQVSVDNIHTTMPFPTLTKCLGEPTYKEMTLMCKEMYQNLATIMSPYGMKQAGFLGVLLLNVLYCQWFNKHFQAPHDPRDYLEYILANATMAHCSKLLAQHKAQK